MATIAERAGELAAKDMCEAINVMGFDMPAFVAAVLKEHRTIQQNFMRVFMAVVEEWAKVEENRFDARNEATVKLAKEIRDKVDPKLLFLPYI